MADEQLRGGERYLDEVQTPPPRWRRALAVAWCLLLPAAVVVGAKVLLFDDMPTGDFLIRSALAGIVVVVLWFAFFRRRLGGNR